MEQIAFLFAQTFRPIGEDPNVIIQQAKNQLDSYQNSPQFCQEVFNLILSGGKVDDEIKKAAINYLRLAIYNNWAALSPESKQVILKSIPEVLLQRTRSIYPIIKKMTSQLISITFFSQEWDFCQIIGAGFSDPANEQNILVALTIMNSLSKVFSKFHQFDEEKQAMYNDLTTQCLSVITPYIQNSQNFFNISICFKIMYHFSKIQLPPLLTQHDTLFVWLIKAMEIQNENSHADYPYFLLAAIKFIRLYLYKYFNESDEIAVGLLNSVIGCYENGVSAKVEPQIAFIIKLCLLRVEATKRAIFSDFLPFVQGVIFPFFYLSKQDIEDAQNDPTTFISNFHSISTSIEDSRSILSNAFSQLDRDPLVCGTLYEIIINTMVNFTPEQSNDFYSICHLFSRVSRTAIKEDNGQQFYSLIAPFFDHEYFLVRCGALLAVQNATTYPPELLLKVYSLLLNDQYVLVQYYAALTFTSLLQKLKEDIIPGIQKELNESIPQVLQIYFNLAETFDNYDFFTVLKLLVKYFGESLVQLAPTFVETIYNLFLSTNKSIATSNLITKTLDEFLEQLSKLIDPEPAKQLYDHILSLIVKSIQANQLDLSMLLSVIQLTSNIIELSPCITSNYWEIEMLYLDLVMTITDISYFAQITDAIFNGLNTIVISDKKTAVQQQTVTVILAKSQEIQLLLESHDCGSILSFLATFFIVLSESTIQLSVADLIQLAVPSLEIPALLYHANELFSALLFYSAEEVLTIIGADRPKILEMWLITIQLPLNQLFGCCGLRTDLFLSAITKHIQLFSPQEVQMFIIKGIGLLNNSLVQNQIEEPNYNSTIEDDFSYYQLLQDQSPYMNVVHLSPIDHKQAVTAFLAMLTRLFGQYPDMLAQIQGSIPNISEILQEINNQL